MQYFVVNTGSQHLEVVNDQQEMIGTIDYAIWLSSKAYITTQEGLVYDIVSSGFWQITKVITRNGMAFAELRKNFNHGINLFFENGRSYYFKKKSFWNNNGYVLEDNDGNEIGAIRAGFSFRNFNFNYEIGVSATTADRETDIVLPLILLYCAKLMLMRNAAV